MRKHVFSISFLALIFLLTFVSKRLNAQIGQIIEDPGVKAPTYKSNQSQVVWYGGSWWGVFKKSGGGTYVYKYDDVLGWTEHVYTGIGSGDAVDIYMDQNDNKLYVLVSTDAILSRLSYSGGNFSLDSPTFPLFVNIDPAPGTPKDDPACITQAQNGHIFIFWSSASNLLGLRSTTQGTTWSSPFTIMSTSHASALTDAISFQYGGNNYVGVGIGEGGGSNFHFWRLLDGGDPTSDWMEETLPNISGTADDHVNMVKDASNNLFMIGKDGDSNNFFLFMRSNDASWDVYDIQPGDATRPALAIEETYDKLLIFATFPASPNSSEKIQYAVLDKDNLSDVFGGGSWTPILENGTNNFNDVTVSYQILDNTSNIMVCATNTTTGAVWYNAILSDVSLPVFIAFFNATSNFDRVELDWATHSEVANYEWIVYRREEREGAFYEIGRLPGAGSSNTITYYHYTDTEVDAGMTYYYRLANVGFDGTIHEYPEMVHSALGSHVTEFALYPNYPNPFNNQTTIHFEIAEQANTVVDIFDISGRCVRRLVEGELIPGSYNYSWNGRDEFNNEVSSGVYALTLSSGNHFQALRIVLIR